MVPPQARRSRTGRLRPEGAAALVLLAAAGAGFATSDAAYQWGTRLPPVLRAVPDGAGPPELVLDSEPPPARERASLLFFQGRPAIPEAQGNRVVVSESGVLLRSDRRLRLQILPLGLDGGVALGVAPAGAGSWWVSTQDGRLLRTDRRGRIRLAEPAPFGAAALWPDSGGGVVLTRSPERFSFLPEAPTNPVVAALDAQGNPRKGRGQIVIPRHALLAALANSGYAVVVGDTVFFAPLSRSEIVALDPAGDILWRSRAAGLPPTPEPQFRLVGAQLRIEYQPLNLALTLGPDGRLYALRALDSLVRRVRLDVLDRHSGRVVWQSSLASPRAALAANQLGRVFALDEDRLLGAIPPSAREPLTRFELPKLGGGKLSLSELAGRMVLINLWASWCAPCRTEMPALDSLAQSLDTSGFTLVAISEDETRAAAARFVAELRLGMPVLFGDGRLRNTMHYPGLPYTILVDRQGRIVRRWIGEMGPSDLELIRMLVKQEIARPGSSPELSEHHHHEKP